MGILMLSLGIEKNPLVKRLALPCFYIVSNHNHLKDDMLVFHMSIWISILFIILSDSFINLFHNLALFSMRDRVEIMLCVIRYAHELSLSIIENWIWNKWDCRCP